VSTVEVRIKRLAHAADLPLPEYQSKSAAGLDLMAAIEQDLVLEPGQSRLVPTGLVLAIPSGFEGQVRPRSGLAAQHGITVLNAPGTIDSDYRGEIRVLLVNFGRARFVISRSMRIAQLVIAPIARAVLREVDVIETTERGGGGFGSTGTKRRGL
jgi:dUTP pyrophosphatase